MQANIYTTERYSGTCTASGRRGLNHETLFFFGPLGVAVVICCHGNGFILKNDHGGTTSCVQGRREDCSEWMHKHDGLHVRPGSLCVPGR